MKTHSNALQRLFLLLSLSIIFLGSCVEDPNDLTDEYPFLTGILQEVPTETICGGPATKVRFLAGQHIEAGYVEISNDMDNIYIQVVTENDWYMSKTQIYVGPQADVPLNRAGNPQIGDFPYKKSHDPQVQSYLLTLPLEELDQCFVIAVHADVHKRNEQGGIIQSETAWAEGEEFRESGSWAMFLDHCLKECVVRYPAEAVATLAYEDMYPIKGDADYNDFVVDMSAKQFYIGQQINRVELDFNLKARGTIYDHEFAIRVPIDGSANVKVERFRTGENTPYETEEFTGLGGENLKVVVFPNTKAVMPPTEGHFSSNTLAGTNLVTPTLNAKVTIYVEQGSLMLSAPFDPILHVIDTEQEVHIIEITQKMDADGDGINDYWESGGLIRPFGIIIHQNWKWPLEFVNILQVYPEFKYVIEDGKFRAQNPEWYLTPEPGSQHFDEDLFN